MTKQSNNNVRFLPHFHSYFVLLQYFEEGCEEGGELGTVNDSVPVHVKQVVEVFNVILGGGLPSHQADNGSDHGRKFFLGEALAVVLVELAEYFSEEGGDVCLCEGANGGVSTG